MKKKKWHFQISQLTLLGSIKASHYANWIFNKNEEKRQGDSKEFQTLEVVSEKCGRCQYADGSFQNNNSGSLDDCIDYRVLMEYHWWCMPISGLIVLEENLEKIHLKIVIDHQMIVNISLFKGNWSKVISKKNFCIYT